MNIVGTQSTVDTALAIHVLFTATITHVSV